MSYARLLEEWHGLLERRPAFRSPLASYEPILTAWAAWAEAPFAPLRWTADDCRERWRRGTPLLSEAAPSISPEAMEPLLEPVLDLLATSGVEPEALRRFADAWDRGDIGPSALFPGLGRIGSTSVQLDTGLSQEGVGFLACASLRPILEAFFAECRSHLGGDVWHLGICPFCGAPPGFADLSDDGQRRLACHLCGGSWGFSRLRCPHCGTARAQDFVRLLAEDHEEGYAIFACKACLGYVKELDRRVRWNTVSALVEDWGSPHLDLIARRAGYWRPVPTLIQLAHAD